MMQMITGFWTSCSIYTAAKLGIADLLAERPHTPQQLAARTQTHAPSLRRLLRALASQGIFRENEQGEYELTPLGGTLQTGVPGSMRAMAIAQLGDHFLPWGNLLHSIKTGNTAFDQVHGMPIWKYYETHPEEGENFMHAMAGFTQAIIMNVLPAYDFSGFKTIADIGGGNGAFLFAILNAAPQARGIVFDEPYVVEKTGPRIAEQGLADRCEAIGGDFFGSIPAGADAYLLKMILHDWDDERAVAILRNIRQAMSGNSRLLLVESVIPEGNDPFPGKFMDLNMLVNTGGRERTAHEFENLLREAGLRLHRIVHTHSPMFSLVEAVK